VNAIFAEMKKKLNIGVVTIHLNTQVNACPMENETVKKDVKH